MINTITITNHLGESITMEARFPEKSGFLILHTDGLDPSEGSVDSTEIATMDGAVINSARVNSRNITLTLAFLGTPTIEETRHKCYKYFPVKRRINIRVETDSRVAITSGVVETNKIDIFSSKEGAVISIICEDAYLFAEEFVSTTFSSVEPLFEFPFSNESLTAKLLEAGNLQTYTIKSVYYEGDASTGIIINIHATGNVGDVKILNTVTREELNIYSSRIASLTGSGIVEGDDVVISTITGNKYAILKRGGLSINIRNAIDKYPSWFQLERGDNIFSYTATDGGSNLQFRIDNPIAYEGI